MVYHGAPTRTSARQHKTRLSFVVVCIVLAHSTVFALDVDVLLELKSTGRVKFSSWRANNTANVCSWEGIQCNNNSRVSVLELGGPEGTSPDDMNGSFPSSLPQLTELEKFIVQRTNSIGNLPPGLFTLSKLKVIEVSETGLALSFPQNITAPLERFHSQCQYGSTYDSTLSDILLTEWPNLDWNLLEYIDVTTTNLSCPLPERFVNFIKSGGRIPKCVMQNIPVEIDENNMLCGQLLYNDFPCNLGTPAYRAKHFTSDVRPSTVDFRVEYGALTMEFLIDEVFFFAAYNKTDGTRGEFRGEYISLRYFPITQLYSIGGSSDIITALNRTRFKSFVWETPQKLRVNMTETSNVTFEYIWEFDSGRKLSSGFAVKFSFVVYNSGHVWLIKGSNIDLPTVNINLVLNYKIQHSPVEGPAVKCKPTNVVLAECASSIASFFTQFDISTSETIVNVETQRTRMALAFPLAGKLDGRILSGVTRNFEVYSGRYPWPLPSGVFLERYANVGVSPNFTNIPAEEQTYIFPLQLVVPRIMQRLDYDPDVSITLLFDPNAVPSASLAPEVAEITSATTIIIITVVVIVAIVISIAGIALFAKVIFPYMNGRKGGQGVTQFEEDGDEMIEGVNQNAGDSGRASRPQTWNNSVMPTMK